MGKPTRCGWVIGAMGLLACNSGAIGDNRFNGDTTGGDSAAAQAGGDQATPPGSDQDTTPCVPRDAASAYGGTPVALPGTVEAERFDQGANNVAYFDKSTGNQGSAFRTDVDVDIKSVGAGFAVGFFEGGEWLEYTVNVAQAMDFKVTVQAGALDPGRTLELQECSQRLLGPIAVPTIASWGSFGTVNAGTLSLTAGRHTLRLLQSGPDFLDLDWIRFEDANTTTPPPTGWAAVVAGVRPRGACAQGYTLATPASGSKEWFVATTGKDTNNGSSTAPFATIQKAADVAKAGDVVTIAAGSYSGGFTVQNSGESGKPIVFQAAACGQVTVTGGAGRIQPTGWGGNIANNTGGYWVTLKGLKVDQLFTGAAPHSTNSGPFAAVRMATGWRVSDCTISKNTTGVVFSGHDVVIERTTIADSDFNSIIGYGMEGGVQLQRCEFRDLVLARSNLGRHEVPNEASHKVLWMDGPVVDNIEAYENIGPGWWFDYGNLNPALQAFHIKDSYFHNNYQNDQGWDGGGFWSEVNRNGLIENCLFIDNEGSGIALLESENVEIRNCLLVNNGIDFRCMTGRGVDNKNNYLHDNGFKNSPFKPCGTGHRIENNDTNPTWPLR